MSARYGSWSLAALSLTALGLIAVPLGAYAQDNKSGDTDTSATDKQNTPVDLELLDYLGQHAASLPVPAVFPIEAAFAVLGDGEVRPVLYGTQRFVHALNVGGFQDKG